MLLKPLETMPVVQKEDDMNKHLEFINGQWCIKGKFTTDESQAYIGSWYDFDK